MKKIRLHFITLFIGVATGISIMSSEIILLSIESFKMGYAKVLAMDPEELEDFKISDMNSLFILTLEPTEKLAMPNELLNNKSGEIMPTRINRAMIEAPMKISGSSIFWVLLCSAFVFAGFIMAAFNFFKIIFAVEKSVIFEWINVKRLQRMGIGFVVMFVVGAILTYIETYAVSESIDIENYKIANTPLSGSILMFGVISFLVAEIFSVGLKLREEQELTV